MDEDHIPTKDEADAAQAEYRKSDEYRSIVQAKAESCADAMTATEGVESSIAIMVGKEGVFEAVCWADDDEEDENLARRRISALSEALLVSVMSKLAPNGTVSFGNAFGTVTIVRNDFKFDSDQAHKSGVDVDELIPVYPH